MDMTPERWAYTARYLNDVFGAEDPQLAELARDAAQRGLPAIAVSAEVGRLLALLASLSGAKRALEIGTLGGYSATWIARGMGPSGRLITLERDPAHADFAEQHLARAGLASQVQVRRGAALEVLPKLAAELGPSSLDFVFLDADKLEYPDYFRILRPLLRTGAVLVADNVLGTNSWWIDREDHPARNAADRLNRTLAADPDFLATAVPLREGLLLARRIRVG